MSAWLSCTTSPRIPFAIHFWLERNTEDTLHVTQKVKVKAAILFLLQGHQTQLSHMHFVTHLWTCLCLCGAAARFASAPSPLRFSYSITRSWSICVFSSVTKGTSFPLRDSHGNATWSGGGKRLTWAPVHPCRFQLTSHVRLSQLPYLTASPEVSKNSNSRLEEAG